MSKNYLDEADTDDEDEKCSNISSPEEIEIAKSKCLALKDQGNAAFSSSNFEEALSHYSEALNVLKSVGAPKDPIILLNRSAAYIGLKRYVPALNDANQAAGIDPTNWKAHWRKGIALMAMSKRLFRTKQAIESFEKCLECKSLPENKHSEVQSELKKSRSRLQQQEDDISVTVCHRDNIVTVAASLYKTHGGPADHSLVYIITPSSDLSLLPEFP